jgi:hypothetical protein
LNESEKIIPLIELEPELRLETTTLIAYLREMSLKFSTTQRDLMPKPDRVETGKKLLEFDRRLAHLMRLGESSTQRIIALTGLIYSHFLLRGMGRSTRIITNLVGQLKESISSALFSSEDIFETNPSLLLWTLLMGTTCAGQGHAQSSWFMWSMRQLYGAEGQIPLIPEQTWVELMSLPNHKSPERFRWLLDDWVLCHPGMNQTTVAYFKIAIASGSQLV